MIRNLQFSYIPSDENSKTNRMLNDFESSMIFGFVVIAFATGCWYMLCVVLGFASSIISTKNLNGITIALIIGFSILAFATCGLYFLWVFSNVNTGSKTKEKIKDAASRLWAGFVVFAFVVGSWYLLWVTIGVCRFIMTISHIGHSVNIDDKVVTKMLFRFFLLNVLLRCHYAKLQYQNTGIIR